MGYNDLGNDWQHSLVLATGSADGSIHVFDLSKGQVSQCVVVVNACQGFVGTDGVSLLWG